MRKLAFFLTLAVASCGSWNAPTSTAPAPGAPCGFAWHTCDQNALTCRASCPNDYDCGSVATASTCPAGECCFHGGPGTAWGARPARVPMRMAR